MYSLSWGIQLNMWLVLWGSFRINVAKATWNNYSFVQSRTVMLHLRSSFLFKVSSAFEFSSPGIRTWSMLIIWYPQNHQCFKRLLLNFTEWTSDVSFFSQCNRSSELFLGCKAACMCTWVMSPFYRFWTALTSKSLMRPAIRRDELSLSLNVSICFRVG